MRVAAPVRVALCVVGTLPIAAWLLQRTDVGAFSTLLSRWFRFQCHGGTERSLWICGQVMPVCSRCLGIYLGVAFGAALARPRASAATLRAWMIAAAVAMIVEVVVQDRFHAPIHALRLATGLLLAWPIALAIVFAFDQRSSARGEVRGGRPS